MHGMLGVDYMAYEVLGVDLPMANSHGALCENCSKPEEIVGNEASPRLLLF